MSEPSAPASPATPAKKFGTFLGVFTPSVLTIVGVMMYLRFGWVVGNVGLPLALFIVIAASSITFITGLSASAIATNMHVGVGGEYFMVSRSLGLELGGAIGIPLFLCRTLSLTLYSFGLAESIGFLWPADWGAPPIQWIAAVSIVLITAVAGRSAELSLKLQIPIMITVGLSVLALVAGVLAGGFGNPEYTPHYARSAPAGFWYVFAVFFPAVTGFTAGIGMSGDLEDPKRSIPRGTLLAVATGTLTYLLILVLLAYTDKVTGVDLATLDPKAPPVWTKIALLGAWLIFPGMWGAILSSAFGSALGGPRVLQALASDGLMPKALARTSKTGQPTIATWVTGLLALAAVALGDLNAVGRWVTIFFLTLYVTINLSAAVERLVGDPSYRPTINVPWYVSLTGSLGAVVVMFLISPLACICAVAAELLLYMYLRQRALESQWGDVRAGLWSAVARFSLLQMRKLKERARNWRPQILLFAHNPAARMGLVRMANWFNQNRGVVTVCHVVEGDLEQDSAQIHKRKAEMQQTFDREDVPAFSIVNVVPDFESGVMGIAQAYGFAGMQANTAMFGWSEVPEGLAKQLRVMRLLSNLDLSTVLVKMMSAEGPSRRETIDVWWGGLQNNGDLMLLLAHLLNLNPAWRQARIKIRSIVGSDDEREPMRQKLADLITEVRIEAAADVLVKGDNQTFTDVMHQAGHAADVTFLGLMIPGPGDELSYAKRLVTLAEGFQTVIFVRNAGVFAGELLMENADTAEDDRTRALDRQPERSP
jgi:amino acid transporter